MGLSNSGDMFSDVAVSDCRGAQPEQPCLLFISMPSGQIVPYKLTPVGNGTYWLCCEFKGGLFGDDRNYSIDMRQRRCTCGNYEFKCGDVKYCKHMRAIAEHRKKSKQ